MPWVAASAAHRQGAGKAPLSCTRAQVAAGGAPSPGGVQGGTSSQGTIGGQMHAKPWVAASAVRAGKH
eukprot:3787356-Alexandrium_andersonii.AAC.1